MYTLTKYNGSRFEFIFTNLVRNRCVGALMMPRSTGWLDYDGLTYSMARESAIL